MVFWVLAVMMLVAWSVGVVLILFYLPRLSDRLRTEGIQRPARVLDIKVGSGRAPNYYADLEVQREDGTRHVIHSALVSRSFLEQGGVGSTWTIYQLPDQPNNVYGPPEAFDPRRKLLVAGVMLVVAIGMVVLWGYLIVRALRAS